MEVKRLGIWMGSRTTESSKKRKAWSVPVRANTMESSSTCGLFHKEQENQDHGLRQPDRKQFNEKEQTSGLLC